MIEVLPGLTLPDEAITFAFSRSGGPGGQHVNKVSSRATLLFDVAHSPELTEAQRSRIMERLATRISKDGVLRVVAQSSRSQAANRDAARERFVELLRWALAEEAPRFETRVPRAEKVRRRVEKVQRGMLKRARGRVREEE